MQVCKYNFIPIRVQP